MINQLTNDSDNPVKIAKIYVSKVHSLFTGVKESRSEIDNNQGLGDFIRITLTNSKGSFTIWYDNLTIGIAIEGADTGYWNTSEEENIDDYFWFAIGVLRNGIKYRKPLIGFQQAWIFSGENNKWAVVPKNRHAYGYTKIRDKFPE
jgi:hypothetical protein